MEIKGIDVSAWQGNIDWKTVSEYGMGFAILRITEIGNKIDSTFEYNYQGCSKYNIPVGVYKYSYATTLSQIKEEANIVIQTLNKRKLDYPVFLDLEDPCQENIPESIMMQMINAFRSIVINAGYKFGIYCSEYWYNSHLPEEAKKYDCWLASYPEDDQGWLEERLRPENGIGWQYSQNAIIPGISDPVDRNVFYKDYTKDNSENIDDSEVSPMVTVEQAIQAVIDIATAEIGYLEKASNSQLDNKTANAGYNNYTKYWRDVYPSYQAQAWCACFVSWVFMMAFGLDTAKKLLKHWPYVYCPTLGSLFTKYANPQVGDIVIFYRGGTFAHTGIVIKVDGDRFWTIEGNTSGASGIVDNGGGVCQKSYYNSDLPGTKFCRPDYSIVTSINSNTSSIPTTTPSKNYLEYGDQGSDVKSLQQKLNKVGIKDSNGNKLEEDGSFGDATLYAVKVFQQKYGLEVDGLAGKDTISKLDSLIASQTNSNNTGFKSFVGACTTDSTPVYAAKIGDGVLATYPMLNRANLVDVIAKSGTRYQIRIANKYIGWIAVSRIVKPEDLDNTKPAYPFVGECVANNVSVLVDAGPDYTKLPCYPILNKGDLVEALTSKRGTDKKAWFQVKIGGAHIGYVRSDYVKKK